MTRKLRPFDGWVCVGQWLSDRTGIPRQTLLSAADTGRLTVQTCEDGTRLTCWNDVQQYMATHKPKGKR